MYVYTSVLLFYFKVFARERGKKSFRLEEHEQITRRRTVVGYF